METITGTEVRSSQKCWAHHALSWSHLLGVYESPATCARSLSLQDVTIRLRCLSVVRPKWNVHDRGLWPPGPIIFPVVSVAKVTTTVAL